MASSESHNLIGYVSDENYVALADVALEFQRDGKCVAIVRSSPRGAIYAEIPSGEYRVTLAKDGFGAKTVSATISTGEVLQFRLISDSLFGYAWPKWVKSRESSEFRVHAVEGYHISLWRYGKTKEFIQPIGWFDEHGPRANSQVLPDEDFSQSGVKWNERGYAAGIQRVTAPARSGLYYFHVETSSKKFLTFPWVVAPAKPQAAIAVLASTNTWNVYNNFGGRSNYINSNALPPTPTVNARLELARYTDGAVAVWATPNGQYAPLSFDRPEPFNHIPTETQLDDPIRGRQACHLAETEWRLLGWLEREGFDYDFYSDRQLHDGTLDLDAYRVLVISTHPEYWSREAYFRVKKWVQERGGKLMYLGGNGIDCEIEFDGDALRCKTFRAPEDEGCRFAATVEPPEKLLGVVFTQVGAGTSAPYKVTDASHWIFAGTGLKNGGIFGAASLHERCPGGASGHETDKRTESSPKNAQLLARGLNPDDGGAEIVYFETPGGGAVFSVGSITWPASILVDANVSRITRNVIERLTC